MKEEKKNPMPKGRSWGDSEHDPVLHTKQKPHSDKPEYDKEYHTYRVNGG